MKDKMSIKVIGIGGMGINFVNFMITSKVKSVEYITIDTDSENLMQVGVKRRYS